MIFVEDMMGTFLFSFEPEASEQGNQELIPIHAARTPSQCRADPMPLNNSIDCVSGGETDEETPKELPPIRPARKKRRTGSVKSQPSLTERLSETFLRSLLGRQCQCKRKTCLQQFVAPDLFQKLRDHREHWYGLHKLDQDAAVPWLKVVAIILFPS